MDDIDNIIANSYKNFHAKGLDYLCLKRSASLTVKAYFFEGNLANVPEIVVPHDHRYAFTTQVLAGRVANREYAEVEDEVGDVPIYQAFRYMTPLNGGSGFEWAYECSLEEQRSLAYGPGAYYHSRADDIHTLKIMKDGTVIVLYQFADSVPLYEATTAYRPGLGHETPSLEGLYDKFAGDEVQTRLLQLDRLGFRI